MTQSIHAPRSIYHDGDWHDAHWTPEIIDEATGELTLLATTVDISDSQYISRIVIVRLTSDLVRSLRAALGFQDTPTPPTMPPTLRALPPAWMLEDIENAYDEENDTGRVTWTDMRLLRAVKDLARYAELLEARMQTLEEVVLQLSGDFNILAEWRDVGEFGTRIMTLERTVSQLSTPGPDLQEIREAACYDAHHTEWEQEAQEAS